MQRTGIRQRDIDRVKFLLGEGKSPEEIAEMYQCPVSTIESFFQGGEEPAKPRAKAAPSEDED